MTPKFAQVGEGVYVLSHPVLDVNVSLVVGAGRALLVDTLSTSAQAIALSAAVRAITPYPWILVNTHHHFDHCFGNATLVGAPPAPVYAHEAAARLLREHPEAVRQRAYQEMRPTEPRLAAELVSVQICPPTHIVHRESILDVGGRRVELRHLGRGHTAGDLVVRVPDADVLIAGDLIEEGAPPGFEDAYPVQWPRTVAELLRLTTSATVVVPGHGAVVNETRVRAQHAELVVLAGLIRAGHRDGAPPERVARQAPFGAAAALIAVQRGYAELDGRS